MIYIYDGSAVVKQGQIQFCIPINIKGWHMPDLILNLKSLKNWNKIIC
jgi:hypothetical protein